MPDVIVVYDGSLVMFEPLTDEGSRWFADHVEAESWQWLGGRLGVEYRYANPILAGLKVAGLNVEVA